VIFFVVFLIEVVLELPPNHLVFTLVYFRLNLFLLNYLRRWLILLLTKLSYNVLL